MTDRITVLNECLMRIGAEPLVSEDDPGAPVHLAVYEAVLRHAASKPFSFFKVTRRLVRLSATPDLWPYAYQLPSDRLGPPRAVYASSGSRQPTTDYDLVGDQLLTTHAEVWAMLLVAANVARWPGDFREYFATAVMAELALSVREDRALHDRLYQKAYGTPSERGMGGLLGAALDMDSQGIPSTPAGGGVNPLVDVRY